MRFCLVTVVALLLLSPLLARAQITIYDGTIIVKKDDMPVWEKDVTIRFSDGTIVTNIVIDEFSKSLPPDRYIVEWDNLRAWLVWSGETVHIEPHESPQIKTIDLELADLEARPNNKVLSSPKITTISPKDAEIKQGIRVPYQEVTPEGSTSVQFKEAVLRLKVTPSIASDGKINMKIELDSPEEPPEGTRQDSEARKIPEDNETVLSIGGKDEGVAASIGLSQKGVIDEGGGSKSAPKPVAPKESTKAGKPDSTLYTVGGYGNTIVFKVNGKTPDPKKPIEVILYRTDSFGDDRDKKFTLNKYGEIELLAPGRPDKSESQKVLEPGPYRIIFDGNYKNQKRLDWDGTTFTISSSDVGHPKGDSASVSSSDTVHSAEPLERVQIAFGAGLGGFWTDAVDQRFIGPAMDFTAANGGSLSASADDSAASLDVKLLFRKPTGSGYVIMIPRYFQTDDFKATASASFPDGRRIEASGKFDVKGVGLDLGYEHLLSQFWSIFGGVNFMRYDLKENSDSRLFLGDTLIEEARSEQSENTTEIGAFVGFGYLFRKHWQVRARAGWAPSVFDDEDITMLNLNIVYWFNR